MAKRTITIGFDAANRYQSDIDEVNLLTTGRFVVPPHLANQPTALFTSIATELGGIVQKDLSFGIDNSQANPCSSSSPLKRPRKAIFKFSNLTSMGLPLGRATGIISRLNNIIILLNDLGLTETIECIDLTGEEYDNLNGLLNNNYDAAAATSIPSGGTGRYYSGKYVYFSDSNTSLVKSIKVLSAVGTAPPPVFQRAGVTAWADCVGSQEDVRFACPASSSISHRRYTVKYRATGNQPSTVEPEERELPVANIADEATKRATIRTCGLAMAAQDDIFCIGYKGESYRGFDEFLNLTATTP